MRFRLETDKANGPFTLALGFLTKTRRTKKITKNDLVQARVVFFLPLRAIVRRWRVTVSTRTPTTLSRPSLVDIPW